MTQRRSKLLPVYPSRSEVYRIIAACANDRDAMLVKLLWHTGGRVSEVIQVRVGDITAAGLRMPNLKQHGPAQKHVFLSPDFLAELRAWCHDKPLDAPIVGRLTDGKPMSRVRAWMVVKAAGARAGVWKRRYGADRLSSPWPHSFRHGNAVLLLENGAPISAVQAQLGHASLGPTEVYTRLTDADRQRLIAQVAF